MSISEIGVKIVIFYAIGVLVFCWVAVLVNMTLRAKKIRKTIKRIEDLERIKLANDLATHDQRVNIYKPQRDDKFSETA